MTNFKMATTGIVALSAALAIASAASAKTVVLSDNFNSDTAGLNSPGDSVFTSTSPIGNAPNAASIDIIGNGYFDFLPGNGLYIDMDGSSGNGNTPAAGQLTSTTTFGPGAYTLTFDLAGNQRGAANQSTTVSLGGYSVTITPTSAAQGFETYTKTFYTGTGGNLVFTENGPSDQQGNLLDNVSLSAGVPEPAAWAMMIAGLGLIGLTLRRRAQLTGSPA